jgi:hypothetical protein
MKRTKRPENAHELARLIEALTRNDATDLVTADGKNAAAVALGRRGGLKGGRARAKSLTAERRVEIAKLAARARWRGGS